MSIFDAKTYVPAFEVSIDGSKLDDVTAACISKITVTKKIDQSDYFSIDFQDVIENGKFKYLGSDTFKYGKKVSISMGYVGKLTHKAVAHIQTISPKFSGGLPPTFSLEGSHKAFSDLQVRTELETYQDKTAAQIVSAIAGQVGLSAETDTTSVTYVKTNKANDQDNLTYIRYLCTLNPLFEFFIDEEKLYFRKAKITSGPVVTLKWGEHLESFTPTINLPNMLTKVTVRYQKQLETEKIEGVASAGSETSMDSSKKLGSTTAKEFYGERDKVITNIPAETASEANDIAKAHLEKATGEYITGSGSTLGIPDIKPGVCIKMENLGEWFSGPYYVTESTHTIDSSGYKTTFKVRRNVL